jgi:hypothetical protein
VAPEPQNVFTDYIKSREGKPGGVGFNPTLVAPSAGSGASKGGADRGWLAGIVDVLNSSLYPQVQQVSKMLDFPETFDQAGADVAEGNWGSATKKVGSNVWGVVSNTWNPMTVGRNLGRAITGAEGPEGSRDTGEALVEKAYDVSQRKNPNYVDFKNNVNPITKAAVGLTFDIAADPLTWVTGASLGAGKIATRGAASIAPAAKAGDALANSARTAADAVISAERIPGIRSIPGAQGGLSPSIRMTTETGEATRLAKVPTESSLPALQAYGVRFTEYTAKMQGTAAGIAAREGAEVLPVVKPAESALGGVDNLPASSLAQDAAEAAAKGAPEGKSATDEILRTVRETIDKKTVAMPKGGRANLRGGLAGLFKTLSKPTAATAQAAKLKVLGQPAFARKLKDDLVSPELANTRLADLMPGINLSVPGVANTYIPATIGKAFQQFAKARKDGPMQMAIANKVLLPLFKKYNEAVTAGKNVNALGLPATATDAVAQAADNSTAAIIAINLKNLDAATRERALALLGEDFFKVISTMTAPDLAVFMDDAMVLLRKSGAIDDVSILSRSKNMPGFLKLFNIDEPMLNAARIDMDARMADVGGITPETLAQNIENLSQAPGIKEDTLDFLTKAGFDVNTYSADEAAELGKALDVVFEQGVKPAMLRTFSKEFRESSGYSIFTDGGVARTAEEFAEGLGIVPNVVNTHGQMDIWINIGKVTNQFFEGGGKTLAAFKGLQGRQRAAAKERFDLAIMRTVENFYESKGVPTTMDWQVVEGGSSVVRSLRFTEAFAGVKSAMLAKGFSKDWMRLLFSNADTGMAASKFMDGIMTAMTGGNVDDVIAVLISAERRNKFRVADDAVGGVPKSNAPISNWLAEAGEWGRFGTFTQKEASTFKKNDFVKKGNKTAGGGTERLFNKAKATSILADAIMDAVPTLDNLASSNAAKLVYRGIAESEPVAEGAAKIIADAIYDATRYVEALRIVDKSGQVVKDVARSIGNVSPLGASLANTKISLVLGRNVKNSVATTTKLADAVAKGDPAGITKATENYYKQIDDIIRDVDNETYKVIEDLMAGRTQLTDPGAQRLLDNQMAEIIDGANDSMKAVTVGAFASIRAVILKGFDPLDQFFNARRGMSPENQLFVSQLYRGVESLQGHLQSKYFLPINQLGIRYNGWVDDTTTIAQQAFNNIREGVKGSGIVGEAQEAMVPFVARLFGGSAHKANALLGNIFLRRGTQIPRVNEVLARNKVLETTAEGLTRSPDEYFDLGLAAERLGPNPSNADVMAEVAAQWKTWDIKDPVQFLDRMYKSAVQLTGEAGYVNKFVQEGLALGVVSKTPVEGFLRIGPKSEGTITVHFTRDYYVDPEVLEAFKATDAMVEGSTGIGKVPFGGQLDEFTDATKYAMTQARLGHHIRNYLGGLTMTHMAMGVKHYGKAHKDAIWTLQTIRNNDEYDLVSAMTSMNIPLRSTKRNAGKAAKVLYTSPKTGKSVNVEQVIDAANRLGIFPKVRTAEAFATSGSAQGLVGRVTQKFLTLASLGLTARGGRMEKFWSTISEAQDHTNRLHLFLQYTYQALDGKVMQRGIGKTVRPKDLEDIFAFAAERVQKFHPTSAVLTRLEKAIPRRLFTFYAWNKGAAVALAEAITMAPGRVNLPGKINYNIGVATGVDPNSAYDPFPENQQFPSWLTEDIQGPQFYVNGKYYGVSPGIAQWDILNQFGGSDNVFDPLRQSFADSLNPAFKLPMEVLFNTRLSTKSPISDTSDWVDQSIPNVGYGANLSGYSPSSIFIDGKFELQDKFARGIKGTDDKIISAVNWFLGPSLTNMSRVDVQRNANIERQKKLTEEREAGR